MSPPSRKHDFGFYVGMAAIVTLCYFGAYFITVESIDVGSNDPMYLVRYRIGNVSLTRFAPFFEPARWIDDACIRRKQGVVIDYGSTDE